MLRCPHCQTRLVSCCGVLVRREGSASTLYSPRTVGESTGLLEWSETTHEWWWMLDEIDQADNLGLSRVVETPNGLRLRIVLCSACEFGPLGHRLEGATPDSPDPQVWLACDTVEQQNATDASDEDDFRAPAGLDLDQLRAMLASSGGGVTTFATEFDTVGDAPTRAAGRLGDLP